MRKRSLDVLTLGLVIVSLLILALCVSVFLLPAAFLSKIESALRTIPNTLTFISTVFSALALLVAAFAFRLGILRPRLDLAITPWGYHDNDLVLPIDRETHTVSTVHAGTEWEFRLKNTGSVAAGHPLVLVKFHGIRVMGKDPFPGWTPVEWAYGVGGWFSLQWSNDAVVVHPGFPLVLPTMDLAGKSIIGESLDTAKSTEELSVAIEITIVADGIDPKTYRMPVKISDSP